MTLKDLYKYIFENLDRPGIAGHAVSKGEIPVIEGYSNKAADRERTLCLREITLARGLYRLGDIGGRGRHVLESYAADPRKVYANYCLSILCNHSPIFR